MRAPSNFEAQNTGTWIAHPADRRNAARALAAPLLLFTPFAINWFAGYEMLYAILAFTLIGDTNYLLHLHMVMRSA